MSEQDSKTEQATEKRLSEATEEGQFPKSPDIQVVATLGAAFCVLLFALREQMERICTIAVAIFGHLGQYEIKPEAVNEWSMLGATTMLGLILPIGMTCAIAAALAGGLQTRFQLSPKVIELKFSQLSPIAGFKRLFSSQAWVKLAMDGAKLGIVGGIIYSGIKSILGDPIFNTPVSPYRLGIFIYDTTMSLLMRFLLALLGIAILHYLYQRRVTSKQLMMTKQEVKEERLSAEGNPQVKMALRSMARRLMQKQMLEAVATADVVVTNPTHYAVALKYERGKDQAPVVLAKGENAFAKRIKALAAANEVPMIENKPVARMLYKHGKVGQVIPMQMYQAVAEILAFVYKTHRYYFHQLRSRRAALES